MRVVCVCVCVRACVRACDTFSSMAVAVEEILYLLLFSAGYFIEPTVIETKDPTHALMREVFVELIAMTSLFPLSYLLLL